MKHETLIQNKRYILLLITLIFIDQISKYLIRSQGGFYICNSNFAFDISLPITMYWVIIIFLALATFFSIFNFQSASRRTIFNEFPIFNYKKVNIFGIWLIISGALSNAIDRLSFGCVFDFINFRIWPIFNLADAFISIGALLLLAEFLKKWYNNPERKK